MRNDLQQSSSRRCPINAPGPFYTSGNCLACQLPEDEAPDLLAQLTDKNHTTYFAKQPQTPSEIERACKAIEVCCVADLRYGGTDSSIIQRLNGNNCDHAKQMSESGSRLTNVRLRSAAWLRLLVRWFA